MTADPKTTLESAAVPESSLPPEADIAPGNPGMVYVKAYLVVYALLLAAYIGYALTGGEEWSKDRFLETAFPSAPAGADEAALDTVFRKSGHLLLWEQLHFQDTHGTRHRIPADERLTRHEAVLLAGAILGGNEVGKILVNKHGFADAIWAYGLTVYNIFGMVMILVVLLKTPLATALDDARAKTSEALKQAREAKAESDKLKAEYEALLAEVETERKKLEETAERELNEEREHIIKSAKHEAETMLAALKEGLETEIQQAGERLRRDVAREALAEARALIENEADDTTHNAAVEDLIGDLKKVKLT